MISLIIIIILLMKRPQPQQFKPSIRHTTPGSAFHASFNDSFANRNAYTSTMTKPMISPPPAPQQPISSTFLQPLIRRPTLITTNSFNCLNESNRIRPKPLGLSSSTIPCTNYQVSYPNEKYFNNLMTTLNDNNNNQKHPPPPPIPQNRRTSASGSSSNGSLSLVSSTSSGSTSSVKTLKSSHRRHTKQKYDKNRFVINNDNTNNDYVMMKTLNQHELNLSNPLLYTDHTLMRNSIIIPVTDIHNNSYITDV
uniref:SJCHGC08915 protein n=1 Tax=Schistosoma japonicum TaxID=6182 RepID=Q5D970_SCHJA|nr:SJCHGC08915 protein [Schistosoma japonicum]